MRRGEQAMILKSGNLLCMARLTFRVKCISQPMISAIIRCCLLSVKQTFFMGFACSYELYMIVFLEGRIKWQAVLLRMHSFPPLI